MLQFQAWDDRLEQPPTEPEAAPAHTALANILSQLPPPSPPPKGAALLQCDIRMSWSALGAPRNSLCASNMAQVTCCCHSCQLLFGRSACAQGNCLARSPAPLQAAPSCSSAQGALNSAGLHAQTSTCCSATLMHGAVKPTLLAPTGMGHHPLFPNYPKVLACRTRPQVPEKNVSALPTVSILPGLQHFVHPGEVSVAE